VAGCETHMAERHRKRSPRDLLFRAADWARVPEDSAAHPFNPKSEIHGRRLGALTGLSHIGVNLLRIPPGKESFVFHAHQGEDEFVYVLSGRGMAEVGDDTFEIRSGDFLGFPAGGPAHHIRNPFAEDLVYLAGGETKPVEVVDFPRLKRRLVRVGESITVYPVESAVPFGKPRRG
jgi:uncharacterized cupin superfamily protein